VEVRRLNCLATLNSNSNDKKASSGVNPAASLF
jgi:hypothetical protein